MHAVLSDLAPTIEEAGAVVEVAPLPAVRGDKANIERLMQNLLSNAIKFRDGLVPQIRIDGRRLDADLVELSVTDNGIGIPPEHAETIFHTYKRLHPANEYDGTGLGLAICRRIVERHGGSIRVRARRAAGRTLRAHAGGARLPITGKGHGDLRGSC